MKTNDREAHREYMQHLDNLESKIYKDISEISNSCNILFSLLAFNQKIKDNTLICFSDFKNAIKNKDRKEIIKNRELLKELSLKENKELDHYRDYISELLRQTSNILSKLSTLKEIDKNRVSYGLYKYIIRTSFKEYSKLLLKGYELSLGFGLSTLKVVKKDRVIENTNKRKQVNWNESLKFLVHLAKENKETEQLGIDYENKKISKKDFISSMSPYVYPNTDKEWLIEFVDDDAVWLHWNKNRCFIPNKSLYSIKPMHGNISGMSHDEILNNKNKDEIIEMEGIYLTDQMNLLNKLDKSHFKKLFN